MNNFRVIGFMDTDHYVLLVAYHIHHKYSTSNEQFALDDVVVS